MIQRTLIPTTIPMARRLARLDPVTRNDRGLAAATLRPDFLAEDVERHLSEAMALAAQLAAAAASDRSWALMLGHIRDLIAIAVLVAAGAYAFAVLA